MSRRNGRSSFAVVVGPGPILKCNVRRGAFVLPSRGRPGSARRYCVRAVPGGLDQNGPRHTMCSRLAATGSRLGCRALGWQSLRAPRDSESGRRPRPGGPQGQAHRAIASVDRRRGSLSSGEGPKVPLNEDTGAGCERPVFKFRGCPRSESWRGRWECMHVAGDGPCRGKRR